MVRDYEDVLLEKVKEMLRSVGSNASVHIEDRNPFLVTFVIEPVTDNPDDRIVLNFDRICEFEGWDTKKDMLRAFVRAFWDAIKKNQL